MKIESQGFSMAMHSKLAQCLLLGVSLGCVCVPFAVASAETLVEPARVLTADTPSVTHHGNTFVAPAGWRITQRGEATVLESPEGGSGLVLIDVRAPTAEAAVAAAWRIYKPEAKWPLKVVTPAGPRDNWTDRQTFTYQTSPNEERDVFADVRKSNDLWTVTIYDMAQAVGEKRAAQVGLVFGKLLPKGYQRESFAGRKANTLDEKRIAELTLFVQTAMQQAKVPGVSVGLYQNGKVVFADGFGVRALGKPEPPDADTRYMIASNTKAMTTLMLGRLVDQGKFGWDTPVTRLLPSFRLGDADTTRQVLVKHLICACTGMPRQDMEWYFEYRDLSPAGALTTLGTMQPTSKFGELYQYSNPMAAAAGYAGGHVSYPAMELGAAYDKAMQTEVFGPLGMRETTLDFDVGEHGNSAAPHGPTMDGQAALADEGANRSVWPVRPAGGAWSSVRDVLRYVAMELADGTLPDGARYVSRETILARRAPQVVVSTDVTYGMGLMVNTVYGTQVVHHGGDMIGYHSDMMWLPDHGVGAVVLTNGDPGWLIRTNFRRKLLEVLFDGRPEADAAMAALAKTFYGELAAERKLLTIPAAPEIAGSLARRYSNSAVGSIGVTTQGQMLNFDFGEWASEMGSRKNPDGTLSLITVAPGLNGFEFVMGSQAGRRTLTLRDAQHEYVLIEQDH